MGAEKEIVETLTEILEDSHPLYSLWLSEGGSLEYVELVEEVSSLLLEYEMLLNEEDFRERLELLLNVNLPYTYLAEKLAESIIH